MIPSVKDAFEALKPIEPDLVLAHYCDDRHKDHRVLSDMAWNTFRDHLILEYEIRSTMATATAVRPTATLGSARGRANARLNFSG